MTRRQEIENIIIGTLLNTFDTDWFADCRYCITTDMFIDERNAKIYSAICEYRKTNDKTITPYHLCYFDKNLLSLAVYMAELAGDYYFLVKKVNYNENVWLLREFKGERYKYTDVEFSDYVGKFVEMVIYERKTSPSNTQNICNDTIYKNDKLKSTRAKI